MIVVSHYVGYPDGFPGLPEGLEDIGVPVENEGKLTGSFNGGELPETEEIAGDDQFDDFIGAIGLAQLVQKTYQLGFEGYILQFPVSAYVQIADDVVLLFLSHSTPRGLENRLPLYFITPVNFFASEFRDMKIEPLMAAILKTLHIPDLT